MSKRVMTADELLGFSEKSAAPIEIELTEGLLIKVRPLDLKSSLELTDKMRTDTIEGMVEYTSTMIAETICEPELTPEQRAELAKRIASWPAPVVTNIINEYYDRLGLRGSALEKAVEGAEAFLAEE